MAFLQISGLNLAFGGRQILKNAHLFLKEGSRAALCGANGSGKTTLLRLLAGEIEPDSGGRALEKKARIAYLPQSGAVHAGHSLAAEAGGAYVPREGEEAYNKEKQITQVLSGLGFNKDDFERDCAEFSGGWQMRIALAKTLLASPDILLLDEPTNYLDIEARLWLLKFVARFSGAVLLVSHDRYFLDETVNEVYELFLGSLTRYIGNYSNYETARKAQIESLIARHRAQEAEIAKNEELIRRFRYKASKAAFVQERIKKLEKIERIEIPENLKKAAISLPVPPHSGKTAFTLTGVSKSYGAAANRRLVLSNIDLAVDAGERLCVAGVNGAGKTTLLRIIAGTDGSGAEADGANENGANREGFSGEVKYGAGVIPAYFNQDAAETICGGENILQYLESRAPTALFPRLRDMAGAFLFRGDDVYKPLNVLSGGEKSRLALLALLLRPANLLVLDEPTNHLDISAKDILLEALQNWRGTIVFVSHDRAFMDALSTKTLELRPGAKHTLFYGNYAYYLDKTSGEFGKENFNNEGGSFPPRYSPPAAVFRYPPQRGSSPATPPNITPPAVIDKKAQRKRQREEAALIELIESLEAEKAACELELASPEVYTSGEKTKAAASRLASLTSRLESATTQWEALC